MNDGKRQLRGSCHCGNIRFVFITGKSDADLPKRECQCSFCRHHGRISTSDPDGELRVIIADEERVTRYRFGHRTADFYVCQNCGGVPVVTSQIAGDTVGLVDVRMIEGFAWSREETVKHDYEDEPVDARLARRAKNWTGTVIIE